MRFGDLEAFRRQGGRALGGGPVALLIAEDPVEVSSTLMHLAARGFRDNAHFAPPPLEAAPPPRARSFVRVDCATRGPGVTPAIVNTAIDALPAGTWLHYCYNAEYLFHPFAETRSVSEMLAFHAEERREAMVTFVVDLYAADLAEHDGGVDRDTAHFDRAGYFALGREGTPERQLDFFGGLRWRFEEHVPEDRRRIDRVALFRTRPGLRLREDHTLSDDEMNTYACPWHNNLTATIASFRAAKALRSNPASRHAIETFLWQGSERFEWSSRQLMDLGLMEPGQWF